MRPRGEARRQADPAHLDKIKKAQTRDDIARIMGSSDADSAAPSLARVSATTPRIPTSTRSTSRRPASACPTATSTWRPIQAAERALPGLRRRHARTHRLGRAREERGRSWSRSRPRSPRRTGPGREPRPRQDLQPDDRRRAREAAPRASTGTRYLGPPDSAGAERVIVAQNTRLPEDRRDLRRDAGRDPEGLAGLPRRRRRRALLSKRFVDAQLRVPRKTLHGQPEQRERWKRGVGVVDGAIGEALGRVYVARYFPPESKAKMDALVGNLRTAHGRAASRTLDWMSAGDQGARRSKKLARFDRQDRLSRQVARLFAASRSISGDLFGNVERAAQLRLGTTVAAGSASRSTETEWGMTPQTVNAYYNPMQERDRLPGRDPAAAVLRSERRPGGQLRRHRRRDRPRDRPRLRRPGPQVRRRRHAARLVDARGRGASSRRRPPSSARSTTPIEPAARARTSTAS